MANHWERKEILLANYVIRVQLLYAGMKLLLQGVVISYTVADTVEMFSRGLSLYVEGYKNREFLCGLCKMFV
jgi:hypothetical protein